MNLNTNYNSSRASKQSNTPRCKYVFNSELEMKL